MFIKKFEIVKEHRDFDNIINESKFKKNHFFVIYNKDNNLEYSRYGIAVGKKIGNAVIRNKVKRQIRMILTNNKNLFKKGLDYIIIVKKGVLELKYDEMTEHLVSLMKG